jgi:hypothetical protein
MGSKTEPTTNIAFQIATIEIRHWHLAADIEGRSLAGFIRFAVREQIKRGEYGKIEKYKVTREEKEALMSKGE